MPVGAALDDKPGTTTIIQSSVPEGIPAPSNVEVERDISSVEPAKENKFGIDEPAPEMLTGELIIPPPAASRTLPEARLITAGEVAGTPQQQP
jgi:hypothetical protein